MIAAIVFFGLLAWGIFLLSLIFAIGKPLANGMPADVTGDLLGQRYLHLAIMALLGITNELKPTVDTLGLRNRINAHRIAALVIALSFAGIFFLNFFN
ncbi:MAG: hypothetical protein C5B49_08015 [Bdellovibrio sp.]|nr:MAG: hypothetical protein C5B49_08015 [Bdellovibrio sp.]